MIWLNPLAWFALAAVAVPILVHLLAHRRAERIPFPTLRFIQPTRLAAIRRRALEDLALLAVRSAIVVLAVAAFAGPLLVTSARRALWNARLVRAVVVSGPVAQGFLTAEALAKAVSPAIAALKGCATPDCEPGSSEPAFHAQQFETSALSEGIGRAVAWLESAPPARRELVIAAPLTLGSVSDADLAAIPADVGIRFTRTDDLPAVRRVSASSLLTRAGALQRTVALAGGETSVREERDAAPASWPVEVVAPPNLQRTADAALAAVLAQRVRLPPADHRARLVLLDEGADTGGVAAAASIRAPWIADAVARIAHDDELLAEAAQVPNGLADARLAELPWHVLARAADGRPIASAASLETPESVSQPVKKLVVAARARAGDLVVPVLLRAIANGLAPASDLSAAEVVPIADGRLRAWTRQPGPPPPPRPETVDRDDRRWLWGGVLLLLMVETWMRRSSRDTADAMEAKPARVA